MKRFLVFLAVLIVTACATSPVGRQQFILFDDAQLDAAGVSAFSQMKSKQPLSRNPHTNQYVLCVAQAIANEVGGQWEVGVFDDDSVNAFALPGGKIGVYTGMLRVARSPAQLATVVGHEVGHVLARHANERASRQQATTFGLQVLGGAGGVSPNMMAVLGLGAQVGLLLPFERTQEAEADAIGLDLMAQAGFDPRESIALWQAMQAESGGGGRIEFLSTHPSEATRIAGLQQRMPRAMQLFQAARAQGKNPVCG